MQVKLDCTKGMWLFLKPALVCWATLNEYTLPSDLAVITHMQLYYSDEFKDTTTRGDFFGKEFRIRVRPGIKNEVQTWAHEFAHMIQAFSLGPAYRKIYDEQQETVGYKDNLLERQACDAGAIALLLYRNGVIEWPDTCDTPGPSSPLTAKTEKETFVNMTYDWSWELKYTRLDNIARREYQRYQQVVYNTKLKERDKVYNHAKTIVRMDWTKTRFIPTSHN